MEGEQQLALGDRVAGVGVQFDARARLDRVRPPGFDEARYEKRNSVERAINRLKQFRAVATR